MLEGDEIIAAYKMDTSYTVQAVYKNPYLQNSLLEPTFKVGEKVNEYHPSIDEKVKKYYSLKYEQTAYNNYDDFISRYTYPQDMLK